MRIAIVSRDFPPKIGGIADHTDLLASELSARGHDVSVLCEQPAEPREAFAVHAVPELFPDGPARIEADAILWAYNPFQIGRHGIEPRAGTLARSLAQRARLVVFFHELWFPWRAHPRALAWAVAQRFEARAVLRHASAAIVTTEDREAALHHAKVTRIPIGATVLPVSADRVAARAALGIASDAFVVAHLGGGHGHDLTAARDAIARIHAPQAGLLLIGATDADAAWRTGPTDRASLSRALQAADAYVHPDPAGAAAGRRTALLSAMAHGLPIVAFRGPQTAPQLRDKHDIVLVPPHAGPLARALETLAQDPDERARIGRNARETYDANFAWGRIAEEVARVCADR